MWSTLNILKHYIKAKEAFFYSLSWHSFQTTDYSIIFSFTKSIPDTNSFIFSGKFVMLLPHPQTTSLNNTSRTQILSAVSEDTLLRNCQIISLFSKYVPWRCFLKGVCEKQRTVFIIWNRFQIGEESLLDDVGNSTLFLSEHNSFHKKLEVWFRPLMLTRCWRKAETQRL